MPFRTLVKSDYHFKAGEHSDTRRLIEAKRGLAGDAAKTMAAVSRIFSRLTDLAKFQCQARFDFFGKDGMTESIREQYRFHSNRQYFMDVVHHVNRPLVLDDKAEFSPESLWEVLSRIRGKVVHHGQTDWDMLTKIDRASMHRVYYVAELAECILKCSPDSMPKIFKTPTDTIAVFNNINDTDLTVVVGLIHA